LLSGTAVVRGIEAALGPLTTLTPLLDSFLLSEIRRQASADGEQRRNKHGSG
jgi:hypothetical protein